MDFGALPPEVNSARMYAGPGPGSMLSAASAWDGLAAELRSTASSYGSVITELTDESWVGPSSTAMAAAATPYVAWLNAAAEGAEQTAAQAKSAASAYQAAFGMMVPPPLIAANRAQLASLTATNLFGLNTPAIATTEAQYGEMWAQDATAMYGYAGNSAAASTLTAFTAPPSTTNQAGVASQAAAVTQAAGASTGAGVQSTLSQLTSAVPTTLQNLASPAASSTSLTTVTFGHRKCAGSDVYVVHDRALAGLSNLLSTIARFLARRHLDRSGYRLRYLPGFLGIFLANDAIAPVDGTHNMWLSPSNGCTRCRGCSRRALGRGRGGGCRRRRAGVRVRWRCGRIGGPGSSSLSRHVVGAAELGLGRNTSGGDDGWRAVGVGVAGRQSTGATSGLPLAAGLPMMGGLPRAAGVAAAAGVGGALASKYAPRLSRAGAPAGRRIRTGAGIRASRGVSRARRIFDERTRAPRIHAGHRVPADQRTCAARQVTRTRRFVSFRSQRPEFQDDYQ